MGDSLTIVVVIILAATTMFIFPMMAMSERNDDVAQLAVNTAITEFVNTARNTGKITEENYTKLILDLYATGNTYDVQIELKVIDANPSRKKGGAVNGEDTNKKVGESLYVSEYTSQIMDEVEDKGYKLMKEGDVLTVKASNTNNTISQMLKNFFYSLSGNDTYSIVGQHSGMVTVTGTAK